MHSHINVLPKLPAPLSSEFSPRDGIAFIGLARSSPKFEAVLGQLEPDEVFSAPRMVSSTSEAIDEFIESSVANVGNDLKDLLRRYLRDRLLAPIQEDDLAGMETNWRNCAADSEQVVESEYLQQHAGFLRDLVCNATTDRQEIAAGIIGNWLLSNQDWISNDPARRDYSSRLARGLLGLDGKECAATKDLSERTKARLSEFASAPLPAN